MATELHLTLKDNAPYDFRIIQGARYELPIIYPENISSFAFAAQIRRTASTEDVLAEFGFMDPVVWDPDYEIIASDGSTILGATLINLFLTPEQTSAIPIPITRTEDAIAGANVWTWDFEAYDPLDSGNIIKVISYSWVEVIPEVTR